MKGNMKKLEEFCQSIEKSFYSYVRDKENNINIDRLNRALEILTDLSLLCVYTKLQEQNELHNLRNYMEEYYQRKISYFIGANE